MRMVNDLTVRFDWPLSRTRKNMPEESEARMTISRIMITILKITAAVILPGFFCLRITAAVYPLNLHQTRI